MRRRWSEGRLIQESGWKVCAGCADADLEGRLMRNSRFAIERELDDKMRTRQINGLSSVLVILLSANARMAEPLRR